MSLQNFTNSKSNYSNGNGAARPLVRGASIVHRKLRASQLAVIAANVDDGLAAFQLTQSALAKALGVSVPMVQAAKRLSPLARQHVLSGKVTVGHYAKPAEPHALLKVIDQNDDEALRAIIQRRGVNHVVDIAAAVEAAQ